MTSLKVLTWNCHSLYQKLSQFKLKLYALKPHIACLCETWVKDKFLPSFINYSSFHVIRPIRQGGGILILVRNDVSAREKHLISFTNGKLEVQAVTVYGSNFNLDILNLYNPNENILTAEFVHYFGQLSNNCIIVGDFNAHNQLWDNQSTPNATGNNLVDSLFNFSHVCLLTPQNLPTHYHIPTRKYSTLDLCFMTDTLLTSSSLELKGDLGSDHELIIISVDFVAKVIPIVVRSRWKFGGRTEWKQWVNLLPETTTNEDFDISYTKFTTNLFETGERIFKRTKGILNPKYTKPWWNDECEEAVKNRHHAKNVFKRHPTPDNLINLRRLEAIAKKTTKRAKQESFKKFCDSINSFTPTGKVWSQIHLLAHKFKPKKSVPFIVNGQIFTEPSDKTELLADVYESIFNAPLMKDTTPYLLTISLALCDDTDKEYNREFSQFEMDNCIKHLKTSSPGDDQIHNLMIRNLPGKYLIWMLNLFNSSFNSAYIPEAWKSALIMPIPKPNKPETDPKSNRPISLLSCIAKLLEKMINNRLNFVIENTSCLSSSQCGFRRRLCTMDQVVKLEHHVRIALQQRKTCIAIFIDFSSAFDSIWHIGLLYKLAKIGITGRMLRWIESYLKNRTFKVFCQGSYSTSRNINTGVPQGSILSPLLFNVMLSDLPKLKNVFFSEYADDLLIYAVGPTQEVAEQYMQEQISRLYEWTQTWGLTINLDKTKGMVFKSGNYTNPLIKINNSPIEFVPTYKYLGMTLDAPRLIWVNHIEGLKISCLKRINLMKSISHYHWGADRKLLLNFYTSYIRSKIDYGCILFSIAPHYALDSLNKIQNQCLRLALGVRPTSPVVSLEAESNIPPLSHYFKLTILKYYGRLAELPVKLSVKQAIFNSHDNLCNMKWSVVFKPPTIMRIFKLLQQLNISKYPTVNAPLISPLPPWLNLATVFFPDFLIPYPKTAPTSQIIAGFNNLRIENYSNFIEIYTDGSLITEPEKSTSSGMVVYNGESTELFNWRLSPETSIYVAELFAISQATNYVINNVEEAVGVVIYTDSLSSVQSLGNIKTKNYIPLIYKVQANILIILNRFPIKIQYVPGHSGIEGNEMADLTAKAGHVKPITFLTPITREDRYHIIKRLIWEKWKALWVSIISNTGRGNFLFSCKDKLSSWPWSCHKIRAVETALAKMRIGHAGVKYHLNRIGKADGDLCSCGLVDTIDHFLLSCPKYNLLRLRLEHSLRSLGVPLTRKNLLGGGPFEEPVQRVILESVATFLIASSRLKEL